MAAARIFALALLLASNGAHAARELVDDAGRKVMLPDRIERVYAAGPPASVLVFAIAPDTLIGWTRGFREDEAQWVPEKYARLPELGRLTGRGNTANETFASLADRVQSQTGIPYVLLDGRLATTARQIEKIASILGAEARGGLASVGLEQVVLRDPAIIVTNDPNFHRDVWKLPVWNSVSAVRAKRVYLSPHLPFGWFDYPPGANRLIGLLWLSEILYPQVFRKDLKREVAEFYRLFYHRAPSADEIERLLGEPGVAPR